MLEVARIGRPASRALVMLHEGLGSVSSWRNFPRRLAEATGLYVIAYSRAGYGRSHPRDHWPIDFMQEEAALLPALLSQEGIDDPILFGHSDGATIALYYAIDHPVPLILLAPHLFVEDKTVEEIARLGDEVRGKLARHHDRPDDLFRGWTGVWLSPEFRHWRIEPPNVPTLAIQGEDDEYGSLAQVAPFSHRLILPQCGHAPHKDHPEEVLAACVAFLSH